jgi:hypothetical protein
VTNEELTALYDVADLFLCASEHEGFCVPIVEAFYKQVPVLAYAATAVPATMDGGGVLYDTQDPFEIARVIEAILDDVRLERAIIDSQDASLARLRARDFGATLLRSVRALLDSGPRDAPEVAWDFWAQFDQFERLEELRQFRPALFKALPEPPAESGLGPRRSPLGDATRDTREQASASLSPSIPGPDDSADSGGASSPESRVPSGESRTNAEPRVPSPESRQ